MTAWRTALVVVAGAAAVTVAALGAPRLFRRLAFFRIRQVEVVGNRYLSALDIVSRLRLAPGASTFDRLDQVRAAAARIPGLRAVSVERRLPGTLRVTVHEESPIALAALGDHLALIDEHGGRLPFDPVRAPGSFPVASADSLTAGLLSRLRLADPLWYDSVQTARLDGRDVLLDAGFHRVLYRADADDGVFRAVTYVRDYLATHGIAWSEIDARFQNRVFVRKAPS